MRRRGSHNYRQLAGNEACNGAFLEAGMQMPKMPGLQQTLPTCLLGRKGSRRTFLAVSGVRCPF